MQAFGAEGLLPCSSDYYYPLPCALKRGGRSALPPSGAAAIVPFGGAGRFFSWAHHLTGNCDCGSLLALRSRLYVVCPLRVSLRTCCLPFVPSQSHSRLPGSPYVPPAVQGGPAVELSARGWVPQGGRVRFFLLIAFTLALVVGWVRMLPRSTDRMTELFSAHPVDGCRQLVA